MVRSAPSPISFLLGATAGPRSMLSGLQPGKKLLHLVEEWLRQEKDQRQEAAAAAGGQPDSSQTAVAPNRTPIMPSKHLAFFR